jgi:hypothetical protein
MKIIFALVILLIASSASQARQGHGPDGNQDGQPQVQIQQPGSMGNSMGKEQDSTQSQQKKMQPAAEAEQQPQAAQDLPPRQDPSGKQGNVGSESGKQHKIQIQNQVQNQGEEQQLQVQTAQQAQKQSGNQSGQALQQARQHMSQVAKYAQDLAQSQNLESEEGAGAQKGIGQQVKQLAQQQGSKQADVEQALTKIESKPRWQQILFGPDQQALEQIEANMADNQEKIEELEQYQAELNSPQAQQQVANLIQALEQENQSLDQVVGQQRSRFALFGWLGGLLSDR